MSRPELSFAFVPSDEDFAGVLAAVPMLKKLRFMEGGLTPARLAALMSELDKAKARSAFSTLWVWKCPGLDIDTLFSFQNLVFLNLELNGFDDNAAVKIAKAMIRLDSLESLVLNHNNIGNAGAQAIAAGLEEQWSLKELQLGDNQIGDLGAQALINALDHHKRLKALKLTGNKTISEIVMTEVLNRFPIREGHLAKFGV